VSDRSPIQQQRVGKANSALRVEDRFIRPGEAAEKKGACEAVDIANAKRSRSRATLTPIQKAFEQSQGVECRRTIIVDRTSNDAASGMRRKTRDGVVEQFDESLAAGRSFPVEGSHAGCLLVCSLLEGIGGRGARRAPVSGATLSRPDQDISRWARAGKNRPPD
jgi:hypothetical protein